MSFGQVGQTDVRTERSSVRRWQAPVLIGAAILLNVGVSQLVQQILHWPLWLDSIGTILVGALLGPLAGAATGVATNLLVGVVSDNHAALPLPSRRRSSAGRPAMRRSLAPLIGCGAWCSPVCWWASAPRSSLPPSPPMSLAG
jgi:hypothetical protein